MNVIINSDSSLSVNLSGQPSINVSIDADFQPIKVSASLLTVPVHGNESHIEPMAEADMDNVSVIDGGNL